MNTSTSADFPSIYSAIEQDGFCNLRGVYSPSEIFSIREDLLSALNQSNETDPSIRGGQGTLYAARNILQLWPAVTTIWQRQPLLTILKKVLSPNLGLVRVLYFDKPPGNTWALPWHKDLTIAVKDNSLPGTRFTHPTTKAGIPHLEAPVEVLQRMLTARIHLDEVTSENGPLKVMAGSHLLGKDMTLDADRVYTLSATLGEVLLIRPLVAHCSNRSHDDTTRHRRILHLEFADSVELPDGFAWHDFVAANRENS